MSFWDEHVSMAEAARRLGVSRQAIHQSPRWPKEVDPETGQKGVRIDFIEETLRMRR